MAAVFVRKRSIYKVHKSFEPVHRLKINGKLVLVPNLLNSSFSTFENKIAFYAHPLDIKSLH